MELKAIGLNERASLDVETVEWIVENWKLYEGPNPAHELETVATRVLFSCGAPVACHIKTTGQCYFLEHGGRTDHDETTSGRLHPLATKGRSKFCRNVDCRRITEHINSWLGDAVATPMPQDFFDSLLQPNYADMEFRREARLWEATG